MYLSTYLQETSPQTRVWSVLKLALSGGQVCRTLWQCLVRGGQTQGQRFDMTDTDGPDQDTLFS